MAPEPTPWLDAIRRHVEQGPVNWNQLVADVSPTVSPGYALRMALRGIKGHRARSGSDERHYTDEEAIREKRIRYGQRGVVTNAINSLTRRGRIVIVDEGDERVVVLGPHPWTDPIPPTSNLSDWGKEILRAVDGGPIPYDDLVEAVRTFVPRDRAIEEARRTRASNRRRRGYAIDGPDVSDEQNFLTGSRQIITQTILAFRESSRVIVEGAGHDRLVMRGPQWVLPE